MAMYGTFGGPASMFGGSLYNPATGAESRDYVPLAPNDPRVTMGRPGGPTNYLGGSASFNERNPGIVQTDQSQQGPSQGMTGQGPFRNPYRQQNPFMQQPPMQTGQYQGGFGQAQYNPFSAGIGSLFGGMGGYGMGYNPMQSMYGNPYMSSYGMGFNPMMGMYGMGNYNPYATMMAMGGFNPFAGQQNMFGQGSMGVPYGTGTLPTYRPMEQAMTSRPFQFGPSQTPASTPAPATPATPAAQQATPAPVPRPAATPAPAPYTPAQNSGPFSLGGGNPVSAATYQKQVEEETAKRNQQLAEINAYQVPTSSRFYQYIQNPSQIARLSGESQEDAVRRIKGQAMEEAQLDAWRKSMQTPGGTGVAVAAKGGLTSLLGKMRK